MRQLALLAMLLGMPVLSLAQTNQNSWDALNTLRAGQKIEVFETNLKKHKREHFRPSPEKASSCARARAISPSQDKMYCA
jgi:hypothetical protein